MVVVGGDGNPEKQSLAKARRPSLRADNAWIVSAMHPEGRGLSMGASALVEGSSVHSAPSEEPVGNTSMTIWPPASHATWGETPPTISVVNFGTNEAVGLLPAEHADTRTPIAISRATSNPGLGADCLGRVVLGSRTILRRDVLLITST